MSEQSNVGGGHVMRWEFDDGSVTATVVCREVDGADCRLTSDCQCERWGEIRRDEIGAIWHEVADEYAETGEPEWHQVKAADYCNIELFINESGWPMELTAKGTRFVIAETAISPVWIDDGCDWEPTTAPAASGAGA